MALLCLTKLWRSPTLPHDKMPTSGIPAAFLERMRVLLGPEFASFQECLEQASVNGLRLNTLKIDPRAFFSLTPFELEPVPWCPGGFRLHQKPGRAGANPPGKHPYHAAGVYYLQEPSAMAVAEILDPRPGEIVLDLAAAPGGKSTHIAALMQNSGLLVANDVHPKRVWELSENLERWGAKNVAITNETPASLAARWPSRFDRVLLDAPCSGEGMFRRNQTARQDWSIELINGCALRQSNILKEAALLLQPGGILVYSTCTFAPEENEGVISAFLSAHPDFTLEEIRQAPGYMPGEVAWILDERFATHHIERTVRLWPHQIEGEGQFIARMRKNGVNRQMFAQNRKLKPIPADALRAYAEFCKALGTEAEDTTEMVMVGGRLYRVPPDLPEWTGLRLIHPGLWLGSIKRGEYSQRTRFEPAHSLALALNSKNVRHSLHLELEQARNYLSGNPLAGDGDAGWMLVALDGFPLGWGKCVHHVVKNYYPKGLR